MNLEKILVNYDKRNVQSTIETINSLTNGKARPINMKATLNKIEELFFERGKEYWNGIHFQYTMMEDDTFFCELYISSALLHQTDKEPVYMQADLTDQWKERVEENADKLVKEMDSMIDQLAEELGVDPEDIEIDAIPFEAQEFDEEDYDLAVEELSKATDSKNKKLH